MAKNDTKTEQMLDVLGNGGSASQFRGCCNTKTQSYILDAIDRVQNLEDEVEEIKNNPDVVDIVTTYADLEDYDTSSLTDKDIIRVLVDETHDDESTYYRWSSATQTWTYIGSSGSGGGTEDYNELENLPSVNNVTLSGNKTSSDLGLQEQLVSGTNIKTINNVPVLGEGNIVIGEGGVIPDNSITPEMTTFIKDINLFDKKNCVKNSKVSGSSGSSINDLSSKNGQTASNIIPVEYGKTYSINTVIGPSTGGIIQYNSNGIRVGDILPPVETEEGSGVYKFTINNASTTQIRFNLYISSTYTPTIETVMLVEGTDMPETYVPYGYNIDEDVTALLTENILTQAFNQTKDYVSKTLYVSTTGLDTNDGTTSSTPLATVAKAISLGGTRIIVAAGNYTEHPYITNKSNIEIICPSTTSTATFTDNRPNTSTQAWTFSGCTNMKIVNITVMNGDLGSIAVLGGSKGMYFERCEGSGSTRGMGFKIQEADVVCNFCRANNNVIDGFNIHTAGFCQFYNCYAEGNLDDGFSNHAGTYCVYEHCIAKGNQNGITPVGGGDVIVDSCIACNNVVVGGDGGLGINTDTSTYNLCRITNCCSYDNETANYLIKAQGNVFKYNNTTSQS